MGPIAAIVGVWSLRLGGYLIARGAARAPEEGRYVELRQRWAPHAPRRFFVFFQAQAALTGVLSTAFVVPFVAVPTARRLAARPRRGDRDRSASPARRSPIAQLARWKRDPAQSRQGVRRRPVELLAAPELLLRVVRAGSGYAVYGLAFAPWGLIALAPQAIILGSILGVTGIPPTENQAIRSKGDAYREYQTRVSRFVPLPPKSRSSDA